jgi:hypothetical protein
MINNNMNINRSKQPPPPPPLLKKPTTSFRNNPQPPSSLSIKNGLTPPSFKLSTPKQNKPIQNPNKISIIAANNRSVPPVPPRKSSIPRPALRPPLPQRDSSTNILLRKPHVSHL